MSIIPKLKPLKANASGWNRDNAAFQRLASAKKAAAKLEKTRESWWASGLTREEFAIKWRERHAEIMNSASDGARGMGRVI